jgi:hypothetical protein
MTSDLARDFIGILTRGRKDNTYKFALARFLVDYSRRKNDLYISQKMADKEYEVIQYSSISKEFLKYYWHQICRYKIKQNFNPEKLPLIVQIIQDTFGPDFIPEPFEDMDPQRVARAEAEITKKCFSEVIPRFQNLADGVRTVGRQSFYEYDRKSISIRPEALSFFKRNHRLLTEAVILEWAKFLERINHGLPRLISKIEDPVPRRGSLEIYKRILRQGFDLCFYCGKPLAQDARFVHADHFIPWSYVYEDELWNLVLSCSRCNLRKHSSLPPAEFIDKLVQSYDAQNTRELKKSLLRLDASGNHEDALNRYYQSCLDYGFSRVRL